MKKSVRNLASVVVVLAICGWFAGPAAASILNDRPVALPGAPPPLQSEILDPITVSGGVSAANDQTPFAYFTNDSGGSVASFVIELAAGGGGSFGEGVNEFGIYKFKDPTVKAPIFVGAEGAEDQATISFLADRSVSVYVLHSDNTWRYETTPDFGHTFGFYLDVYDSLAEEGGPDADTYDYTVYSEDDLNTGANNGVEGAGGLVYQGDNETVLQVPGFAAGEFSDNEFIVAFEDGNSYEKDFADLVVLVEGISPIVPEPASIVVWCLLGLIGIAAVRRGRNRPA